MGSATDLDALNTVVETLQGVVGTLQIVADGWEDATHEWQHIIGQGWTFPIKVNAKGGLDWSTARLASRRQSGYSLDLTRRASDASHFRRGHQGLRFESNSELICARLETAIQKALTEWEPRIQLVSVQATRSTSRTVWCWYRSATRSATPMTLYNMVYPFFLTEGPLMPLPDIELDNRGYRDLVNELRRRIPAYTPEWTDSTRAILESP